MRWSPGFRFFMVGVLTLLMFIPMFFVGAIIDERVSYSEQTLRSVASEWGGRQTINGPLMIIPVEGPVTRTENKEVVDPVTKEVTTQSFEVTEIRRKAPIYVYPNQFNAQISTESQERSRGIFVVPVFTAEMALEFDFDLTGADDMIGVEDRILWQDASLRLGVTANKALRGEASLRVDGRDLTLEPVPAANRGQGGIKADLGDPRDAGTYNLSLGFNGADQLKIAPVGRLSQITFESDWPHPSFQGAFLPNSSEISDAGFTADWTIPHLARPLPQMSRDVHTSAANDSAFGVSFFQPNDFYQKSFRAARYAILFIALTFLTVLLIENRTERPTHPVQYLLIGLAQSIFVLLMVAYSEQIGFAPAYALASLATTGLLTVFGWLGLKLGRRTLVLGALLLVLYAVLYVILQSADYALIAGTTLAFLALAATMFATRNEEWFNKDPKPRPGWFTRRQPVPPPAPDPVPNT